MSFIRKVNYLGIEFVNLSYTEVLSYIMELVESKKGMTITFIGLKQMIKCLLSKKTKNMYQQFDMIIPTGVFLNRQIHRVYPQYKYSVRQGADLITPIFKKYHENQYNFMMLGATAAGGNKLMLNLAISFPGLKLIGLYSKDFVESREEDVSAMVKKGDVSVIYVGLGRTQDEKWVLRNKSVLEHTISICVNNSVEVMAGDKKDIPYAYRSSNKDYIYMLKRNPFRVFDSIIWIILSIKTFFFKKKIKKKKNQS